VRILVITYYFPPAGGGGVQRVLSWCRHLPELGVEVTVAAPEKPRWVDVDTTLVVPASVEVLRTPDPSPAALIPREHVAGVRGLRKVARTIALQPRRFAVPDIHRAWRGPAVGAIIASARERKRTGRAPWDLVISSSPPETTHLVACDVAEQLGIPWIADFRDSWLDLPHLRMDSPSVRLKHARNTRLAQRTLARASALTTVSEPLAADLRARHPELQVHVLENGMEPADIARGRARMDGFRDTGRFVVAYTGNFFGRQSPAVFLEAVERFVDAHPDARGDLIVRFVGGLKPVDRARIDGAPTLAAVVEHIPFLRHDDVLAQQAAADLLFLYVAPGRGSAGVYTGKVFEYVASRRPVLAQAPAGNVAASLLVRAGAVDEVVGGALLDPQDVSGTADALERAWRTWRDAGGRDGVRTSDVDVPSDVLVSIDRSETARRLVDLARTLVD